MDKITDYSRGLDVLPRREVVAQLLKNRGELLVVTGLGAATYDVFATSPSNYNFYLWGAMGSAAITGLGIAMAKPDIPVLVITGDGESLMGLGALATIGVKQPKNLTVAVLDNGHYGETGMQKSHSSYGICLNNVASACNFDQTSEITSIEEVKALQESIYSVDKAGPTLHRILVEATNEDRVLPTRDCVEIKNKFRAAQGLAV